MSACIQFGTGVAVSRLDVEPKVLRIAAAGAHVGRREVLAELARARVFMLFRW